MAGFKYCCISVFTCLIWSFVVVGSVSGSNTDVSRKDFTIQSPKDNDVRITKVKDGIYYIFFSLEKDEMWQSNRTKRYTSRAEIIDHTTRGWRRGTCNNFAFNIPPNVDTANQWHIVYQLHGRPDIDQGEVFRSPILAVNVVGNTIRLEGRYSGQEVQKGNDGRRLHLLSYSFHKGEWEDITLCVKLSGSGEGVVRYFRNGLQLIEYEGPLGYVDKKDPYVKFGVYKGHDTKEFSMSFMWFSSYSMR